MFATSGNAFLLLALGCGAAFAVACGGETLIDEPSNSGGSGGVVTDADAPAEGSAGTGGGTAGTSAGGTAGEGSAGQAGSAGTGVAGSAGSGGVGPEECNMNSGHQPCDYCIDKYCHDSCVAAESEPSVGELVSCYMDCVDDACVAACDVTYPEAAGLLADLYECMEQRCCAYCASCKCSLGWPDAACDECMNVFCIDACYMAADSDYFDCQNACSDPSCSEACDATYPEAAAGMAALIECLGDQCATECPSIP